MPGRRTHLWLAVGSLVVAAPACAAILGDDFVVVDDDDDDDNDNGSSPGSTGSGSGCATAPDCTECLACQCPVEMQACAEAGCHILNDCLFFECPPETCSDVCAFPDEWGAAELSALMDCGCATCDALCDCTGPT